MCVRTAHIPQLILHKLQTVNRQQQQIPQKRGRRHNNIEHHIRRFGFKLRCSRFTKQTEFIELKKKSNRITKLHFKINVFCMEVKYTSSQKIRMEYMREWATQNVLYEMKCNIKSLFRYWHEKRRTFPSACFNATMKMFCVCVYEYAIRPMLNFTTVGKRAFWGKFTKFHFRNQWGNICTRVLEINN